MWVIGLIVLAAFIAFLVFTPPMKAETAEKLLEKNNEPDDFHNDGGVKWLQDSSRELYTNPFYRGD
ncbi:MAG: hypothetical protein AB7E48_01060 [Deferribacterales bacterium]